jgi:hypothetical protein
MYTRRPLPPISDHLQQLGRRLVLALGIVAPALAIGIGGYHGFEKLCLLDSLLNASMILSGMGPLHSPVTDGGKLFASAYALFSAFVFLTVAALVFGPVVHRAVHRFHWEMGREGEGDPERSPGATRPK